MLCTDLTPVCRLLWMDIGYLCSMKNLLSCIPVWGMLLWSTGVYFLINNLVSDQCIYSVILHFASVLEAFPILVLLSEQTYWAIWLMSTLGDNYILKNRYKGKIHEHWFIDTNQWHRIHIKEMTFSLIRSVVWAGKMIKFNSYWWQILWLWWQIVTWSLLLSLSLPPQLEKGKHWLWEYVRGGPHHHQKLPSHQRTDVGAGGQVHGRRQARTAQPLKQVRR